MRSITQTLAARGTGGLGRERIRVSPLSIGEGPPSRNRTRGLRDRRLDPRDSLCVQRCSKTAPTDPRRRGDERLRDSPPGKAPSGKRPWSGRTPSGYVPPNRYPLRGLLASHGRPALVLRAAYRKGSDLRRRLRLLLFR